EWIRASAQIFADFLLLLTCGTYLTLVPRRAEAFEELCQCRLSDPSCLARYCPIGDFDKLLLGNTDLAQQPHWIQSRPYSTETCSYRLARTRIGQQSLIRRSPRMVALRHLRPVASLTGQLERRLKEIHIQPNRHIQST